jgi:hypothetical protein
MVSVTHPARSFGPPPSRKNFPLAKTTAKCGTIARPIYPRYSLLYLSGGKYGLSEEERIYS